MVIHNFLKPLILWLKNPFSHNGENCEIRWRRRLVCNFSSDAHIIPHVHKELDYKSYVKEIKQRSEYKKLL